MSLSLFFAYLAAGMLALAAGAVHLLRSQARVVDVLRRNHPRVWHGYGQPRRFLRGLSRMPSFFEWRAHRELADAELDRHCADVRRSSVVNVLLPVLVLAGLYALVG